MTEELPFAPGRPVTVKCFSFYNPESINGPFGTFQLWIEDTDVAGRMTVQVLFGFGATTTLNLSGTRSGTNPIVCTMRGDGFIVALGQPTVGVDQDLSISFASDWSKGELFFTSEAGTSGGGFPVQEIACSQA